MLTLPAADYSTAETSAAVAGTAADGAHVDIYRGADLVASGVSLDATGAFQVSVPLNDGANVLSARAYFRTDELSTPSGTRTVVLDADRPTAPLGVLAEAPGRWGYPRVLEPSRHHRSRRIQRLPIDASFADTSSANLLTATPASSIVYTDMPEATVTSAQYYRVTAVDLAGNESPLSVEVSATPDRDGPTAAIALTPGATPYDATRGRFGDGSLGITVTVSEALGRPPLPRAQIR